MQALEFSQSVTKWFKNLVAVEPNDAMRIRGIECLGKNMKFLNGSAEKTGLESNSFDLITMASSFHWTDTQLALKEFDRALSEKGVFCAILESKILKNQSQRTKFRSCYQKFKVS